MNRTTAVTSIALAAIVAGAAIYLIGYSDGSNGRDPAVMGQVVAAERSPTGTVPDRDVYYPGTEELKPDEMRIVALGTGMPSPRPKQAAACWMVELGNGDKFLFDLGAGCHERIAAQKIPYDYIDKVFLGHLHVDHYGDLPSFWLGGTTMNRLTPLRIWGPTGQTPEYDTAYAMDRMQEMYVWDIGTRAGFIDFSGGQLEVHEFPYEADNEVIFNENGVVVRSFPALHAIDGAVSFNPGVEWPQICLWQRYGA
jgi:ribonuclease Z